MLKHKPVDRQQGFTLVEVLAAILVVTVFVSVTMQAMVVAALLKSRGKEYSEATTWIQEKLEAVKRESSSIRKTQLVNSQLPTDTVLTVKSVEGFAAGDALAVGTDSKNNIIQSINATANTITLTTPLDLSTPPTGQAADAAVVPTPKYTSLTALANAGASSIVVISATNFVNNDVLVIGSEASTRVITGVNYSTNTITFSPALTTVQAGGAIVAAIPQKCRASSTTEGFGDLLQQKVQTVQPASVSPASATVTINGNTQTYNGLESKQIGGRKFWLGRYMTVTNQAPFNVLEITYAVLPYTNNTPVNRPIAHFRTEVIPDASFYCPQ